MLTTFESDISVLGTLVSSNVVVPCVQMNALDWSSSSESCPCAFKLYCAAKVTLLCPGFFSTTELGVEADDRQDMRMFAVVRTKPMSRTAEIEFQLEKAWKLQILL
jgi:hypothetical protein